MSLLDQRKAVQASLLLHLGMLPISLFIFLSWSTHWFHMEVTIPDEWVGQEVRLRWDSGGEAMVWIQGEPQQVILHKYC